MSEDAAESAVSLPATMRAWRQDRYGGPEVVRAASGPLPVPGKGEVLLRVRATALNAGDIKVMRGEPLLVRPAFGMRGPRRMTRGMDVAGTVVAIGPGVGRVEGLAIGDEVMGELPGGALAEYAAGPASRLVPRPAGLDPVTAAAVPLAGGTARQALDTGGVGEGHRVLVLGASGGVGTFTVQLAALRGAEVWAMCGARSAALVAGLGAARTFDYREVAATELPEASFDAVIDIAGTSPLQDLRRLTRRDGAVVLVSGEGGRVLGPIGRILRSGVLSMTGGPSLRALAAAPKAEITRDLAALAAAGRLRPVIERTWPLSEADAALTHVDSGHTVGKVVVVVA